MCDLNGVAACRERLLASVQNHHDHAAVVCDSYAAAARSVGIVVIVGIDCDLAVLYKPDGCADRFLNVFFIGIPLCPAANDRRTVLQNAEEVSVSNAVVFHAFHDQGTARRTVAHVVKVSIDTDHCAVIRYIFLRIVGVGMLCLCGRHLVRYSGHFPHRSIVVVIICVNTDIIPRDVRRCKIADDLLIILSQRHFCLLNDAGCKDRAFAEKDLVIRIVQVILCRFIKIIGKRIAARLAQIRIYSVRNIGALKCFYACICAVCIIHRTTDIFLAADSGKSVLQEE